MFEKPRKFFDNTKVTFLSKMNTFRFWKYDQIQSASSLAKCGFYAINNMDLVACFYCGIILGSWKKSDVPWIEHLKYSCNCTFLNLNKNVLQLESSEERLVPNLMNG